jgi:hypothetical protein
VSGPVVTFDFATWTGVFPEFAACTEAQGQSWFNRASFLCTNDTSNPANATPGMLQDLLYLLTSHIGWLNAPRDGAGNPAATGQPASPIVGRIATASEGSVSVGAEVDDMGSAFPMAGWYLSTRYGTEYLAATACFRTALYAAHPTVVPGPPYTGRRFY